MEKKTATALDNLSNEQIAEIRFVGYSYIRQGKYDIALPLFAFLVELNENSLYDLQTLGALYLQLNDPTKSIAFLEKALKKAPKHSFTRLNYTKALLSLGYKEMGLKHAKKLRKHPNSLVAKQAKALLLAFSEKE